MSEQQQLNLNNNKTTKRNRKVITLNVKLEILKRFENGEKLSEIASAMGLANSTIGTIRENKDRIKAHSQTASSLSVCKLSRRRSDVMENMEKLLVIWIEDKNQRNLPLNSLLIREKAKCLYDDLKRIIGENCKEETFAASKGWFENFKRRHQLKNFKINSETTNADELAAQDYPSILKQIIDDNGYSPQQVFNVDETGFYWKRMPERTFISKEEKCTSGYKVSKDRLTLLLGGNASGDFKLKPLLVYHSENPKAMKGICTSSLPIIWRSNKNAWVTTTIFEEWFKNYFCPAVEKYCAKNNLCNRALLILENSPGRSNNLAAFSNNIRVEFFPKTLMQPMSQGVINTFKAYYLRKIFCQLIRGTDGENCLTIREFWKQYNIKNGLDNIIESWKEIKKSTMNHSWQEIWPECVLNEDEFQIETVEEIRQNIVTLANELGFEDITEQDVIDLLESHGQDLSNEELFQLEQEGCLDDEDKTKATPRKLTIRQLSAALSYFESGLQILTDNDPIEERSYNVAKKVNETISCYKQLYIEKRREAKTARLEAFFKKDTASKSADDNFSEEDTLPSFRAK